jgi:hypothetical protein
VSAPRSIRCLGLALAALLAIAPSCAAPVLPLPPPTALVEAPPDAMGLVTVTGSARPGAFVGCLNQRTEDGVIVRADVTSGAYTLRIAAEIDDTLSLWQFEGTSPGGEQTDVVVPSM